MGPGEPPVWYHGSSDVLAELDANDPGYVGSLGYGLYLTSDPNFAAVFGGNIHEVLSPVPDDEVADLTELMVYECGNSLVIYTPGSQPFTFVLVDRATGQEHRYSVLEDCEEEVKGQLQREFAKAKYRPADPEIRAQWDALDADQRQAVSWATHEWLVSGLLEGKCDADEEAAEAAIEEWDLDEGHVEAVQDILSDIGEDWKAQAAAFVAEHLGDEIGLDDISATAERHGYSAFHIDGYSGGGDEYVIFDEHYLPVPVLHVDRNSHKVRRNTTAPAPVRPNMSDDDYRMEHRPASPEGGAPLYDLTANGVYPADVYGPKGGLYYGDGADRGEDNAIVALAASYRGKPSKTVKIYRAVPRVPSREDVLRELEKTRAQWLRRDKPRGTSFPSYDALVDEIERVRSLPEVPSPRITINEGDWVTIWKPYANQHARGFGRHGKVITKTVRADELWTDGNSIYEWGYWPRET
jgi:hypothetical protein